MTSENEFSRRRFIEAVAALGSIGLASCTGASRQSSKLWAPDRSSGTLPPRGEFVVRNAYLVTMDPKLGDIPRGDLHVRNGVGSLTPGKRADFILVRTNDLNVTPFFNPVLLLVQQAQPANVDTVVVDGRILKHKGELVAIDTEEVVRKATESFAAARKRAGGPY
jgi:hypothetical protein